MAKKAAKRGSESSDMRFTHKQNLSKKNIVSSKMVISKTVKYLTTE